MITGKITKKQLFAAFTISLFLISTLFINQGNARSQVDLTLQSSGIVSGSSQAELTVILRCLTLTLIDSNQDIVKYVDNFVGNYTFAKNMIILISDLQIDGILQYPNLFNQTSGSWPTGTGWTWTKIKTLIDSFHAHGWKVWWSSSGVAWHNLWLYNYVTKEHPELAFTDANGYLANDAKPGQPYGNMPGNKSVSYNTLIPDFWANYTTPDTKLGIANNTRLIDVITGKLGQIISSGLRFDGWTGVDGWNGFNIQWYNFHNGVPANTYSFSYQEENEWASDKESGFGLSTIGQPSAWSNWNITQRASWILNNSTASQAWYQWWCYRFAQMYLQVKTVIMNNNPEPQKFYSAMGADTSSQWTSGNLGGDGLLNFTMVADNGAIDLFVIDPENTYSTPEFLGMPKTAAYSAALVKAKDARLTTGIGIQMTSYGDNCIAVPEWNLKQQYLAQAQNYVWYDGVRVAASDRTTFFLQFVPENPSGNVNWATKSWNNTAMHNLFEWVNTVNPLLKQATPLYLGPTKVNGYYLWGADAVNGISYTLAQWADAHNLQKSAANINSGMGTLLLEQSDFMWSPLPLSYQDTIFSMVANASLNLIIGNARGSYMGGGPISTSIFSGTSETRVEEAFSLTYSVGSYNQKAYIADQTAIDNPTGRWIASGYSSTTTWTPPTTYYAYCYRNLGGLTPIALSADGKVSMGIKENSVQSKLLYMCLYSSGATGSPNFATTIPRDVVNRALYWVSESPINSSNALLDYKIFQRNGDILIPMINQKLTDSAMYEDQPISSILNVEGLKLGSPSEYNVYWITSPDQKISVSNWNSVSLTLKGGADLLVVSKNS